MSRFSLAAGRVATLPFAAAVLLAAPLSAQGPTQPIDAEYTAKIKEYLTDARISTELVDHLPASSTVPTPLKFLGRIVGTPGELTYAKDIHRLPGRGRRVVAACQVLDDRQDRGRPRHGGARRSPTSATLAQLDTLQGGCSRS
ncbi:MAG: hypothetical protein V9E87_12660 [Gemmatimonadales bacterium]